MKPVTAPAENLCLTCGLCCDGALFKDVELQAKDSARRLRSLHPALAIRNGKFPQPCAALCADKRCAIYADRPARCRRFDCALLQSFAAGQTTSVAARHVIRDARQRADKVRQLLRALGNTDEHLALSLRFKRERRCFDSVAPDETTAEVFAELTLAVHELNLLLAGSFYPDPV